MRDWLVTKGDSVSTLPQWSVAKSKRKSFKLIDGQLENTRRKCFYFAMMKCCLWWMSVRQTIWWTGREPQEKMFLLCDDEMLPLMDVRPSNKLMDRSRTEGENISFLRWWTVAATRAESFRQIDGQVENWRRNCFYFSMMICCCWWISVLQGYLGTGGEQKQRLIVLWADDVFPWSDASPWSYFVQWFITKGPSVPEILLWFVAASRSPFNKIDGQVKNIRINLLVY